MNRVVTALSIAFGYMFLGLSFFVTAETIMRKVFNISFQERMSLAVTPLLSGLR